MKIFRAIFLQIASEFVFYIVWALCAAISPMCFSVEQHKKTHKKPQSVFAHKPLPGKNHSRPKGGSKKSTTHVQVKPIKTTPENLADKELLGRFGQQLEQYSTTKNKATKFLAAHNLVRFYGQFKTGRAKQRANALLTRYHVSMADIKKTDYLDKKMNKLSAQLQRAEAELSELDITRADLETIKSETSKLLPLFDEKSLKEYEQAADQLLKEAGISDADLKEIAQALQ